MTTRFATVPIEGALQHAPLDEGAVCLIVTGAPEAGKSTVSRLVAEGLGRSARLDGDFFDELILSGRVWALGEPADEAARQVALCRRNLCAVATNFADAGFADVGWWFDTSALTPEETAARVLAEATALGGHGL